MNKTDSKEIIVLDKEIPLEPPAPDLPPAVTESPLKPRPIVTPAQARDEAVANALRSAYERASTLKFTDKESQALCAEFADEDFRTGANGNERLIYLEHAALRQRFNDVLGIGQWSPIVRSRWAEDVESAGKKSVRVYVEVVLLVRGAFAGEAIGAMTYFPNNAAQNYSDAVEGAKSEAIRRCAKELGVGLQAWRKDFCEGWFARREPKREQPARRFAQPVAKQEDSGDEFPTNPLDHSDSLPRERPEPQGWQDVVIHFGKNKGVRLGDLKPQQLKWYQKEWQPREFRGKMNQADLDLRAALDASMGKSNTQSDDEELEEVPF